MSVLKHHEFSPSKLPLFDACPYAYINCKNAKYVWNVESEDSSRGTLMHEAVYSDESYSQLSDRDKSVIDTIRKNHIEPYSGMEHYHELYVELSNGDGIITAGYVDDFVISPDGKTGKLSDYKFGNEPVAEAANNPQMIAYASALFQKFPKLEKIFATVIQPVFNIEGDPEKDFEKQVEFNREELDGMIVYVNGIIRKSSNSVESDANVSSANCKHCAKLNCPAYIARMNENMRILSIDADYLSVENSEMTVDFADRLLCAKKQIESVMEERTELARKVIVENGGSANFRIQTKETKRTDWKSISAELQIPQEVIDRHTTVSESEPYPVAKLRAKSKKLKA